MRRRRGDDERSVSMRGAGRPRRGRRRRGGRQCGREPVGRFERSRRRGGRGGRRSARHRRSRAGARPAQHGLDAGAQLAGPERLGDVVVRTCFESEERVDLLGACRQHHHVGVGELTHPASDLVAVEIGQPQVDGDHDRCVRTHGIHSCGAGFRLVHDETGLAQQGGHEFSDVVVVLDDDGDAPVHPPPPPRSVSRPRYRGPLSAEGPGHAKNRGETGQMTEFVGASARPSPQSSRTAHFAQYPLRRRILLSQLPLTISAVLVTLAVQMFEPHIATASPHLLGGMAGILALTVAAGTVPWQRFPAIVYWVIPLLDFVAIAPFWTAARYALDGMTLLTAFPVFWLAWSGLYPVLGITLGFLGTAVVAWWPYVT